MALNFAMIQQLLFVDEFQSCPNNLIYTWLPHFPLPSLYIEKTALKAEMPIVLVSLYSQNLFAKLI